MNEWLLVFGGVNSGVNVPNGIVPCLDAGLLQRPCDVALVREQPLKAVRDQQLQRKMTAQYLSLSIDIERYTWRKRYIYQQHTRHA